MLLLLLACHPDPKTEDPLEVSFPDTFHWGAAGAAHQIEGGNNNNQWSQFETLPEFADKVSDASGEAVRGWDLYETDVALAADLGLDVYRLSVEWSRVEPSRDTWDEEAFAHYAAVLAEIRGRGMEPMVTLHHFTDPIWLQDLTDPECARSLCGWPNPEAAEELAELATELGARFGGDVDEWTTFNEPMVYAVTGWVGGAFPPGKQSLTAGAIQENVFPVVKGMLNAHAAAYAALKAADGVDADGDGTVARVGFCNAMNWIEGVDAANPDDVAAASRIQALYGYAWPDAVVNGTFDADLDGVADEDHPEWAGTVDLLGLQYYNRLKVRAAPGLPPLDALPCDPLILATLGMDSATAGCPEPNPDDITQMGYEHYPAGIRLLLTALAERYPGVPLRVTENGIATTTGRRRAESVVWHLEEVAAAIEEGAPVDGYIHWSLTDNFEWAEGFRPRFGLYTVDYATYERTPNEGADVYGDAVRAGGLRASVVAEYAGEHLSPGE